MNILKSRTEDVFGDVDDFYSFVSSPFMTIIFRNGGYVAGGFPRMMFATKKIDPAYFAPPTKYRNITTAPRGDIDIFFRNQSDFEATKHDLNLLFSHSNEPYSGQTSIDKGFLSAAGFARDYFVQTELVTRRKYDDCKGCKDIKVQLISSWFGEPIDIINNFDFTNAKIGFDLEYSYIDCNWHRIHDSHVLDVCHDRYDDPLTGYRIAKYVKKGYTTLTDRTALLLFKWIEHFINDTTSHGQNNFKDKINRNPTIPILGKVVFDIINSCDLTPEQLTNFVGFVDIITEIGKTSHTKFIDENVNDVNMISYDSIEYRFDDLALEKIKSISTNEKLLQNAIDIKNQREQIHTLRGHCKKVNRRDLI